ncbi:MAG: hypothetical protein F7C07_02675 [Desulfurococcales archaeon]|nr:hypothetical protein [Desulfurococcales archaeon]
MPRRGFFRAKIADYTAKIASGLIDPDQFDTPILARHVVKAVRNIGMQLRSVREGLLFCALCKRGPFTKKGYFLHLTRIHYSEILQLVDLESERISFSSKNAGF